MTSLWSRRSTVEELAEEMESHVLEKAEALEAEGMSPDEALREARRSFGNKALLQDKAYEIWTNDIFSRLSTLLRFALAQLRHKPLFVIISILVLSLGIGANTAIFSCLHQAIFRKLPVADPDSLVFVSISGPQYHGQELLLSYPLLSELASQQTDLEALSGWMHDRVVALDENNQPRSMNTMLVTGNAFDMLGIRPATGRLLTPEDTRNAHPALWPVVLGYELWNAKYHRNSSVIGQHITVSGHQAQVVGVAPEGFEGIAPNVPTQMYLPITFLPEQQPLAKQNALQLRDYFIFKVLGRLRKGVKLEEADSQLRRTTASWLHHALPPSSASSLKIEEMSLHLSSASRGQQVLDEYAPTLSLLQVLMACGLLFCCINVAGLQLTRNLERAHEFAIRVALGANRGHLIQQCLMEAFLISAGGAILALPLTVVVSRMLSSFLTQPGASEIVVIHPDWGIFAIAGALTIVCAAVIGIVPVIFARNTSPVAVLKSKSSMKRSPSIASKVLLIAQFAATFLLIAMASFYWRTLHHIYEQRLGYNPEQITEIAAQFQELGKTPEELMKTYNQMLHKLNAQQAIESATMTWITQFTTYDPQVNVELPGKNNGMQVSFNRVGPLYFQTLQTKLLAGREFTEEDENDSHCILNNLAAQKISPADPIAAIGHRVRVSNVLYEKLDTSCEVVGVVAAAKYADIHKPPPPILFLPITPTLLMQNNPDMVFLLRGENEDDLENAYVAVLSQVAPGTGYLRFLPMQRQLNDALGKERLLSYAATFFGIVALFLCAVATLSLLLMRVRQSIPEIAIRMALGASPKHAAGIILFETLILVASGTAIGIFSLGAIEFLSSRFTSIHHVVALRDVCGAAVLLFIMAFVTGGIPALQAATLQPMQVLCRES